MALNLLPRKFPDCWAGGEGNKAGRAVWEFLIDKVLKNHLIMKMKKPKLTTEEFNEIEEFILHLSKDREFCEIISDFLDECLGDPNFFNECLKNLKTEKEKPNNSKKSSNS